MPCSREVCRSPFDRKQIRIPWCHLEYDSAQLFLQAANGYRDAHFVQDTIRCVMSAIRLWVKRKFFTTTTGRIGASGTAAARVLTKAPMDTGSRREDSKAARDEILGPQGDEMRCKMECLVTVNVGIPYVELMILCFQWNLGDEVLVRGPLTS